MTDVAVDADDLDRARIELNHRRAMNGVRENIARLIVRASDPVARMAAIRSVLAGESKWSDLSAAEVRDAVAPVRKVALLALRQPAKAGDVEAIALINLVADGDPSNNLKKEARSILAELRGS